MVYVGKESADVIQENLKPWIDKLCDKLKAHGWSYGVTHFIDINGSLWLQISASNGQEKRLAT